MKTDKRKYYENLIYNTQYLIRDIFSTKELKKLKIFLDDIIKDKEESEKL